MSAHEPNERSGKRAAAEKRLIRAALAWDAKFQVHAKDCSCRLCIELGKAAAALRAARRIPR